MFTKIPSSVSIFEKYYCKSMKVLSACNTGSQLTTVTQIFGYPCSLKLASLRFSELNYTLQTVEKRPCKQALIDRLRVMLTTLTRIFRAH